MATKTEILSDLSLKKITHYDTAYQMLIYAIYAFLKIISVALLPPCLLTLALLYNDRTSYNILKFVTIIGI